jgi:hypothetical protein
MNFRGWWRRRPLPSASHGTERKAGIADAARLEALAERAYAAMYDVPPLRSPKDDYDNACVYFQRAIDEARRLGLASEGARLTQRREHIRAVYDSQFRGF